MRHRHAFRKLSRSSAHRRSLLKTQVTQLTEHERIETTVAKAKEVRKYMDRVITMAKRGTFYDHQKVRAFMQTREGTRKVFYELSERFKDRSGGYTRVLKTRFRRGDRAEMAVIELSDTKNTILTPEMLARREERKTKHRRQGLAAALD